MQTRYRFGPLLLTFSAVLQAQPLQVNVHADRVSGEIRPIWNLFGYDEAGTALTSGDGTLALKWSSTNVYTEDACPPQEFELRLRSGQLS